MSQPLKTVNPETIPELCGRFEPVRTEIDASDLPVQGELPRDLSGAYFRNGPNPRFAPLGSYTYPLEGDGMVHGLWLEEGRARYANRWVRTRGMAAEEQAGHALYGGLLTPAFVDMTLLGPDPDPGWPFRLDPFINVVCHAGRYLALEEGTPPYEITPELGTVGLFDFGGALPGCAPTPRSTRSPVRWCCSATTWKSPTSPGRSLAPTGSSPMGPTPVAGVDRGYMVHDFAITEHYVVLVIGPEFSTWRPCCRVVLSSSGARNSGPG